MSRSDGHGASCRAGSCIVGAAEASEGAIVGGVAASGEGGLLGAEQAYCLGSLGGDWPSQPMRATRACAEVGSRGGGMGIGSLELSSSNWWAGLQALPMAEQSRAHRGTLHCRARGTCVVRLGDPYIVSH